MTLLVFFLQTQEHFSPMKHFKPEGYREEHIYECTMLGGSHLEAKS